MVKHVGKIPSTLPALCGTPSVPTPLSVHVGGDASMMTDEWNVRWTSLPCNS